MVIVEPFRFIKSTAFDERIQLANKLNEIIEAITPIDPETINDINDRLDALVDADTVINGRIDNLVASDTTINNRITTLDAKNVKTDTEQTITGKKIMSNANNDIKVLDTPSGIHQAVNQSYVESTIQGVNNIYHKSGNEEGTGNKSSTSVGSSSASAGLDVPAKWEIKSTGFDRTVLQGINRHYPLAGMSDRNGKSVCKLCCVTSDAEIRVYLQFATIDETSHTLTIATIDRTTGVITPGWSS